MKSAALEHIVSQTLVMAILKIHRHEAWHTFFLTVLDLRKPIFQFLQTNVAEHVYYSNFARFLQRFSLNGMIIGLFSRRPNPRHGHLILRERTGFVGVSHALEHLSDTGKVSLVLSIQKVTITPI